MLKKEMLKKEDDTYSLRHEDAWIPFARAYQNHFHMKNTYLEFLFHASFAEEGLHKRLGALVDALSNNSFLTEEVPHEQHGAESATESVALSPKRGAAAATEIAVSCTKLCAAAIAEIARREKTSLQVMTSSENADLTSFLRACGFQVKRRCYECRYTKDDLKDDLKEDFKGAAVPSVNTLKAQALSKTHDHLELHEHRQTHDCTATQDYQKRNSSETQDSTNAQDCKKIGDCIKKRSSSNVLDMEKIHGSDYVLERTHDGEKDYDDCARMLYRYYQETHRKISPLTVPFEIFSAMLPETVYFVREENHAVCLHRSVYSDCSPHPNDAEPIHTGERIHTDGALGSDDMSECCPPLFAAFVEENEIAYLCGRLHPSDLKPNSVRLDTQRFQDFLNALLSELFASDKEIFFEADDVDPLATTLMNRFRFRPKHSFDTYLFELEKEKEI